MSPLSSDTELAEDASIGISNDTLISRREIVIKA